MDRKGVKPGWMVRWARRSPTAGVGVGVCLMLLLCTSGLSAQEDVSPLEPLEEIEAFESLEPLDTEQPGLFMEPLDPGGPDGDLLPVIEGSDAGVGFPNYTLRLEELEDRLNDLREEIFRSKSRLVLLRERVLGSHLAGTTATITHIDDMSAIFELERLTYILDSNQIFASFNEDGTLGDRDEIVIYEGAILPGPHNLSVEVVFVGSGYGIFSYLEGYRFRVRSSYAFTADEGRHVELRVVAYEQGGVNQPIEERPDMRYEFELTQPQTNATSGE